MENEQKVASTGGSSSYGWPAPEVDWTGAAATVGAGATDGQRVGGDMGETWTSDDRDVEAELANDIPAELSMEEQVFVFIVEHLTVSLNIILSTS